MKVPGPDDAHLCIFMRMHAKLVFPIPGVLMRGASIELDASQRMNEL